MTAEQPQTNIKLYLFFKWFALLIIFLAESFLLFNGTLLFFNYLIISAALAVSSLLTLVIGLLGRARKNPVALVHLSLLCDLFLTLFILHLNGGAENPWQYLPMVIVFIAGYIFNPLTALIYAVLASLSACLIIALDYYGVIPHYDFFRYPENYWHYWKDGIYLYSLLAGVFMFNFLSALISGGLNRDMKKTLRQVENNLAAAELSRLESEQSHRALLNLMEDLDRARIELENKVNQRTRELEATKASLESKVAARTADLEESRKAIIHMMKNLKEDISKLQVVDKMKTEFLSMVSHELRTPLTPIKGYLALITSGKMGALSPQQQHALDLVARQAEHLHSLIDNVLDVARLDIGKPIPMLKQLISIGTLIDETAAAMRLQAGEKQLKLTVLIDGQLPTMMADETKLKRVLSNLIGNAMKFTPEGGEITVRAGVAEGPSVRIEVNDNGIGLARENLEKVFEKFYQVDNSATRSVGGIGMGLPISRELVNLHGGKLWAESDGPGKGSRFILILPVV